MNAIKVGVYIDAPPSRVWQTLMDFAAYPEWNPFVVKIDGEPSVGQRLRVRLKPPNAAELMIRPTVLALEEGIEFRWLGHFIASGLFDGEHAFTLESLEGGRTLFWQHKLFAGILVPQLESTIWGARYGFCDMNVSLKARLEGRQPPSEWELDPMALG